MKHLVSGLLLLANRRAAAAFVCCALASFSVAQASPPAATGSIVPNASIGLVGIPEIFTVNVIPPQNTPPPPVTIDFGDFTSALLIPPYPQNVSHTYAAPGTYILTLKAIGNPTPITQTTITILDPANFSLTATPTSVIAGQAVYFTAITGAVIVGAFVDFGDGTSAPASAPFNHLVHRYSHPALYTARLRIAGQGVTFAQTHVAVAFNPVRVPIGQVYSTFLVGSPVMAGADTSISMTYRIITPFVIGSSGFSPLQAIVELTDSKGRVIQRSDPYSLPFSQNNVNAVQTAMIPYTVPADAGGDYLIRVYVRADQGGTIAVGRAQPLQIIGGPDPSPRISNQFHANGAVLTNSGTNRGGYNVNLGLTTALQWATEELLMTGTFDPVSKRVDPLFTLESATPAPITAPDATPASNSTSTAVDSGQVPPPPSNTGTPAPGASATPEPSTTVAPASSAPEHTPSSLPSPKTTATPKHAPSAFEETTRTIPAVDGSATPRPESTPAANPASGPATLPSSATTPGPEPAPAPPPPPPAQPSLTFKDVGGRTDASLPSIIGGRETLRGLDATYSLLSGWTFHGGAGFFQLASAASTERSGELIDITKAWSGGNDNFRVAYSRNQDNVNKFVSTGTTGPLDVSAGVFEFNDVLTPHIRALLTAGRSYTHQLGAPTLDDSVDRADLNYNVGSTTFDVEYHNSGPQFGTLSGASALSDRAGGAASLSFSTSPISTLALNYGRENVRSVFSQSSTAVATFNIAPQNAPGITLGLERDKALAPGSDTTTKTLNFGVSKTGISSINVTGTLSAASDALVPEAYSTTRTGVFAYQYTNGPHTFGAGINATNTTSASPAATFTESLNYGFTFGGRMPANTSGQPLSPATRNFETKLALTNVNQRGLMTGQHTATLTGLLSWHLTPQFAPGLEGNYQKVYNNDPSMNSTTSFLRLRLDVNI